MGYTVEELGMDRETLFPKYHADVAAGHALVARAGEIEAAQDRVAMRRYIRKYAGMFAPLLNIGDWDAAALGELVDLVRENFALDESVAAR